MNDELRRLYESTAEDLVYGIGLLPVPDTTAVPLVHVHYRHWSRAKLEVVRESFRDGLSLVSGRRQTGRRDLYVSTREQMALHQNQDEHTSILRAPAWDAHLPEVAEPAYTMFETHRRGYGGFVLLVQTPCWEFLTLVVDPAGRTTVGPVQPRSLPMPPDATSN